MEFVSPVDCRNYVLSQQIKKVFFCDTIPLRHLCDDIVQGTFCDLVMEGDRDPVFSGRCVLAQLNMAATLSQDGITKRAECFHQKKATNNRRFWQLDQPEVQSGI